MIKRTKELITMKVRIVVTAGYMIKKGTEMIIIKVRTVVISGKGSVLILEFKLHSASSSGWWLPRGSLLHTCIFMLFLATML